MSENTKFIEALLTQIDYYQREIERLTAERDEWIEKFEALGAAGEVYFEEQRETIARRRADLAAASSPGPD